MERKTGVSAGQGRAGGRRSPGSWAPSSSQGWMLWLSKGTQAAPSNRLGESEVLPTEQVDVREAHGRETSNVGRQDISGA